MEHTILLFECLQTSSEVRCQGLVVSLAGAPLLAAAECCLGGSDNLAWVSSLNSAKSSSSRAILSFSWLVELAGVGGAEMDKVVGFSAGLFKGFQVGFIPLDHDLSFGVVCDGQQRVILVKVFIFTDL